MAKTHRLPNRKELRMLKTMKNLGAENPAKGIQGRWLHRPTLLRLVKMRLVGSFQFAGRPRVYFLRCKVNNG